MILFAFHKTDQRFLILEILYSSILVSRSSHLKDGVGVLVDILHGVHPAVVERPEVAAWPTDESGGAPGSRSRAVAVDAGRQRCILVSC